jgi:HD-GYP domain-containing protein (c-di-GMP phosphodiesterase class II)
VGFLFRKIANKNKYISEQNSDLLKKNEEITSSRVNLLVKNEEIIKQRDIIQNQHHTIELQKANIQKFGTEIIECLTEAIEIRDAFTGGHSRRVAKLAYNIGKEMGLDEEELLYLQWSGLLHDVGKIGIPESILNKEAGLSEYEFSVI